MGVSGGGARALTTLAGRRALRHCAPARCSRRPEYPRVHHRRFVLPTSCWPDDDDDGSKAAAVDEGEGEGEDEESKVAKSLKTQADVYMAIAK